MTIKLQLPPYILPVILPANNLTIFSPSGEPLVGYYHLSPPITVVNGGHFSTCSVAQGLDVPIKCDIDASEPFTLSYRNPLHRPYSCPRSVSLRTRSNEDRKPKHYTNSWNEKRKRHREDPFHFHLYIAHRTHIISSPYGSASSSHPSPPSGAPSPRTSSDRRHS